MAMFGELRFFKYFFYNFCFFLEDLAVTLVIHGLKGSQAFTFLFTLGKQSSYRYVKVSSN